MKTRKTALLTLATASAALLTAGSAHALVASPDLFGFDFRFNNPGARANAMGGAFIGLADDATAAYTNPAGLTVLTRSEVSAEYKQGTYTTVITDMQPYDSEYESHSGGLSFLSFAYPTDKATITVFRHKMIDSQVDFVFSDPPANLYHNQCSFKLKGLTYGVGVGYKVLDRLSLGLAVNSTQLDYLSTSTGYNDDLANPANTHPERIDNVQRATGSDNDEHFTLSMLWNVAPDLNLGLVYRQGPKYSFDFSRWNWQGMAGGFSTEPTIDQELKVPDVYGIGLSYSLPMGLTFSGDATLIKYSQLFDNILWEKDTGGVRTYVNNSDFYVDDEWEYRFGMEYVMDVAKTPLALRGGYYYRPSYYFKYRGTDFTSDFATNVWTRDADNIFTAGLGLVLSENVQVDMAGMFGDYTTEGILSLVYRLK